MDQLLIVRHGIAEPDAETDAARALTDRGRARMRRSAAGLVRFVPALAALYSSPLLRAMQTARIIGEAFGGIGVQENVLLAPGAGPERLAGWLEQLPHAGTVALVGHEPGCSLLAAWLLTGQPFESLPLGKGGACLLDTSGGAAPGMATLVWLATPRLLRRAGR